MFIGCFATGWFSVILIRLQYYCKEIYKSYRELNTHDVFFIKTSLKIRKNSDILCELYFCFYIVWYVKKEKKGLVVYFFLKTKPTITIVAIIATVAPMRAYSSVLSVSASCVMFESSATTRYVVANELSYDSSPRKVAVIV